MKASLPCAMLALFASAMLLLAGDVSGIWKMSFQTPDGQNRESTMKLKTDAAKVTGTISSQAGEREISDGKLEGDKLTFSRNVNFNGNEFTMKYDGKVSGNEIKFNVTAGERSFEMTAKKVE